MNGDVDEQYVRARTGRRAAGLEGALVDRSLHTIHSLDPSDDRSVTMNVAAQLRCSSRSCTSFGSGPPRPTGSKPRTRSTSSGS